MPWRSFNHRERLLPRSAVTVHDHGRRSVAAAHHGELGGDCVYGPVRVQAAGGTVTTVSHDMRADRLGLVGTAPRFARPGNSMNPTLYPIEGRCLSPTSLQAT